MIAATKNHAYVLIATLVLLGTFITTINMAHAQTTDDTLHGVVVAVKGQHLDPSYESFVVKHPTCAVLAVIDNADDELSPFIYTKLACHMTQLEIDNLPEDENVLSVTPLYTVNLPVVMN